MGPQGKPIERDTVREQLHRILTSQEFARSKKSIRLLKFLIEYALEGCESELKEYIVGVEGIGKGADFDTRSSSIVRVEAARLRNKLRKYYETEGAEDPVLISIPRGGYLPRMDLRQERPRAPYAVNGGIAPEERARRVGIVLTPQATGEAVKVLVAAICRSLEFAGISVLPPASTKGRGDRRRRAARDHPAVYLELQVREPGLAGPLVSVAVTNGDREVIWVSTHRSTADLVLCGCRIAREVFACFGDSPSPTRWSELGYHLLSQLTPTALWNSRICFEQAILEDGRDRRTHEALALVCALLYIFDATDPESLVSRVRESAPRGITSESGVDSYIALAIVAWGSNRNWREAEHLLSRARKLRPESVAVAYCRALCLASAGRNFEAAEELLQTYDAQAFSIRAELALGCALWMRGECKKAVERLRYTIAAEPKHALAHLVLGWILLADSRPSHAIEPLETARALSPGSPASGALGFALAQTGRTGEARDLLEELLYGGEGLQQREADLGLVHLGLGEEEQARRHLGAAWKKGSGRMRILNFTPELDSIRTALFPAAVFAPLPWEHSVNSASATTHVEY
jgi:tetratricopeptide (TPR) repeat protein